MISLNVPLMKLILHCDTSSSQRPIRHDGFLAHYASCEEKHKGCCSTAGRLSPSLAPVRTMATMRALKRRITSCTTGCSRTCCSRASEELGATNMVGVGRLTLSPCLLRMIGPPLVLSLLFLW